MPGLGLAVKALRSPAMPLIKLLIIFGPAFAPAAGAEQSGIIVTDDHGFVGPPLR
jgi:hypothetical protein